MMPSKTPRKGAPRNPSLRKPAPPDSEAVRECALELRRIGDKWNLRQKILNLISKLFCPET
ncbi:phorbol-12-myristate-13-acetate-induced protein 1 [Zootoca vivipara]|uniref:phorbol-12-myristate-13-acetate-induced protein 1 n=1 Tax=Zootoca vivipara TaxID=8524 RepID=UPI00293BB671|nr:phorbol-12-myristate-13-acetate-induced protein 1 [Zootoca vivipara]